MNVTESLLATFGLLESLPRVYIGQVLDGVVRAERVNPSEWEETPTHAALRLGRGSRWRFPEDSNTVFWWESPSAEDEAAVNRFLDKRGFSNLRHLRLNDRIGHTIADMDNIDYSHGRTRAPNRFKAKGRIRVTE